MSWTEQEAQELIKNVERGKGCRPGVQINLAPVLREIKPKMNRTETRYSNLLDLRVKAGEIEKYRFGKITLLLVDPSPGIKGIRYTPDFQVITKSGKIEFHEVKGKHIREDSCLKFKMAINEFPEFEFIMCIWTGSTWLFKPDIYKSADKYF